MSKATIKLTVGDVIRICAPYVNQMVCYNREWDHMDEPNVPTILRTDQLLYVNRLRIALSLRPYTSLTLEEAVVLADMLARQVTDNVLQHIINRIEYFLDYNVMPADVYQYLIDRGIAMPRIITTQSGEWHHFTIEELIEREIYVLKEAVAV